MGNKAPVNVTKIIETSEEGNIRTARGIQATAGIGRITSKGGKRTSLASAKCRWRAPARPPPIRQRQIRRKTRIRLAFKCAGSFGECRRSHAAATTSAGDGRLRKETTPRSRRSAETPVPDQQAGEERSAAPQHAPDLKLARHRRLPLEASVAGRNRGPRRGISQHGAALLSWPNCRPTLLSGKRSGGHRRCRHTRLGHRTV